MAPGEAKKLTSQRQVDAMCEKLRRRQLQSSRLVALETAHLLKTVVSHARFNKMDQLIDIIKSVGKQLGEAQPFELSTQNVTRKILHLVREEQRLQQSASQPYDHDHSIDDEWTSLSNFMLKGPSSSAARNGALGDIAPLGFSAPPTPALSNIHEMEWVANGKNGTSNGAKGESGIEIKPLLIGAIQEVIDEIEGVEESIGKSAVGHIHSGETILTLSYSSTVLTFLKSATKDRKFTVLIAESFPSYLGHLTARSLASHHPNIAPVLINDSSIHAVMPRVTKLLLPASSILSTGGIFSPSGALLAAYAAKAQAVPVVVCAGMYKLTNSWNVYQEFGAGDFGDPAEVLPFEMGGWSGSDDRGEEVEVVNPKWDYVGPELIDVFLTDHGDHAPSYIYRLVKENYDDEDDDL